MPARFGRAIALSLVLLSVGGHAADRPLVLERTIPLDGVEGRIDHMAVDLGRKRLFVAELGNDTVDAVDLDSGKVVHRLAGLDEPQGIAYLSGPDLLVVANGGDGSVRVFQGEDLAPAGSIASERMPTMFGWMPTPARSLSAMAMAPWRSSIR